MITFVDFVAKVIAALFWWYIMSFFQSSLRRDLQWNVNKRTIFEVSLGGRSWWWVRRNKKIGPLLLCWYQILWFDEVFLTNSNSLLREFSEQVDIPFGSLFLQLGCDTPLQSLDVASLGSSDILTATYNLRKQKESDLRSLWFFSSRRENMPLSTVITPCLSEQELLSLMHPMLLRNIKKASACWLSMLLANDSHRKEFYLLWSQVADSKGMHIMNVESYALLQSYLTTRGVGNLFVAMEGGRVVAGSIVIFYQDTIIYLYGAASRGGHRGAHAFLQHHIMIWWYENRYAFFDHWGSYPTGFMKHHLVGVGQFKEKFWWKKVEYVGNYDAVFFSLLYRILAWNPR